MRVAFFLGAFPVVSETFILRQITGLIDLGHDVDIYADSRPDDGAPTHPEVERYQLLERTAYMTSAMPNGSAWECSVWPLLGQTWESDSARPTPNFWRVFRAVPTFGRCLVRAPRLTLETLSQDEYGFEATSLSALYRLALLASRPGQYDVLHAHFGPVGKTFRFARTLWRAPLVVTFHGYDFSAWPRHEGASHYARLFDSADAVTVNSDYARGRLEELGCPSNKTHRLPVGVNLEEFAFRERAPEPDSPIRILTVGRLVEKKGIEYALRAVAAVRQSAPEIDLRYDVIGEGPLRPQLESLIRELGLTDRTRLHGAQDTAYVRRMMEEAHLFVLPSVTATNGDQEGTPVSLMEAQACGLPVLSTWHSGIPEVVRHEVSGYLLPERDVDGLATRLLDLLKHPESWPLLGQAGRRHIERHYDIRQLNRQLVDLYRHARARGAATPVDDDRARVYRDDSAR